MDFAKMMDGCVGENFATKVNVWIDKVMFFRGSYGQERFGFFCINIG